MSIEYFFFNAVRNQQGLYDRTYNAQDFTNYLDLLVGSGVFPNPSTNLQVMANSGMNILVKAGAGWIEGHKMVNKTDYPLTLSASDVLNDRIDRIVFYVDYTSRSMGISVLEGTPAASPTAPNITRNESRLEYSLATVRVVKQSTAITQANITDTRPNSSVCGWVQGLIQQVDTSTLFNQWQAAYNQFFEQLTAWQTEQEIAFQTWLDHLTEELKVDTYIEQYQKTVTLSQSDSKIVPLNMAGYTYEESDIIFVILNGLVGIEATDYLIDTRQTPPEVHLNFVGSPNVTEDVDIRVLKSKIGMRTTN